jgi:hypothetical protein
MTAPRAALAALLAEWFGYSPSDGGLWHRQVQYSEPLADFLLVHGVTLAPPRAPSEPATQAWSELFETVRQAVRHGDAPNTGLQAIAAIQAEFVTRGQVALPPRAGPGLNVERLTEILAELYQRPEGSTLAEEAAWLFSRLMGGAP